MTGNNDASSHVAVNFPPVTLASQSMVYLVQRIECNLGDSGDEHLCRARLLRPLATLGNGESDLVAGRE